MTLFAEILFSLFTSLNFFIKNQFFGGTGTTDLLSFFSSVPYISIIIIPALCYKKSYQIYVDFIPNSQIKRILSNFLNIFTTYLIMLAFLIPPCLLVNLFGQIEFGQIFTSLLCLVFYGASIISVCIFINELFSNSILSFVISAILLAIFNSIHLIPVYINLNIFVSSLLQQFSFAWHFDAASKGIIDSRDIFWLFGNCIIFLFLSFLAKEIQKGKRFSKNEKLLNVGLILTAFLFILNSTSYYTRLDCSKNKSYSVSKYTKQLTNNIENNIQITYYRSSSLLKLYPQIRDVSDYLTTYASLNKKINYSIKDPDKNSNIKSMLESYGITTQQLKTVGTNSTEYLDVYSAIVIEYNGDIQIIPFLMSSQTLEFDLDLRIKQLISGKNIIVNIIIGNGMTLYNDYNFIVSWLNTQGILVNNLSIEDPNFEQNLELCTGPLLVIGDDKINIEAAVAIENYILTKDSTGIFAVSPYSADIEESWEVSQNKNTNIVEILENWGVTFTSKIAADISCARITMYSMDESSDPFTQGNTQTEVLNYPQWISLLPQENCQIGMTLFWPTCLELSKNAVPYLVTSPSSYYYQADMNSPSKVIESNPFLIQQDSISNYELQTNIIGAQIIGPLEGYFVYGNSNDSNIIVIPDQYFLNTLMTGYIGGDFGDYRNFEFLSNSILNLNGEEELAKLQSKTTRDTSLYKINDLEQFKKLRFIVLLVTILILPLCFIIINIVKKILYKKNLKYYEE